jgi:hypothetical protein
VNPQEGQETCVRCAAGTYQDLESAATCKACTLGYYCAEGSGSALACPAGSFGNRTDLHHIHQCQPTQPGFFSSIGQSVPEACPLGTFTGQSNSASCEICPPASTACALCSAGSWCAADRQIPCSEGTYNSEQGASRVTNCTRCPPRTSTVDLTGATSRANCSCSLDFYLAPESMPVAAMPECREESSCCTCPIGSDCSNQADLPITLADLPVVSGYFRLASDQYDVRRCADAAANCPRGRLVCDNSTSGCQGGRELATICRRGLTGTYCRLCAEPLHYYVSAATGVFAHCEPCKDAVQNGLESGLGKAGLILASAGLLAGLIVWCLRRNPKYRQLLAWAWHQAESHYTLRNKLKILVGFYMIATKIEDVYQVFLPPDVRAILQQIRIVISLGLDGIPLACVHADGYVNRLFFWMLSPLLLISLAAMVVCVQLSCHACAFTVGAFAKRMLPIVMHIAFLVYPYVVPTLSKPPAPSAIGIIERPFTLPAQSRDKRRL